MGFPCYNLIQERGVFDGSFRQIYRRRCGHLSKHYERAKDEKGEYIKFGNKDIDTDRTPKIITLLPTVRGDSRRLSSRGFQKSSCKKGTI